MGVISKSNGEIVIKKENVDKEKRYNFMKKRFLALTLAALLAVETGVMGNAINVNAGSMDDKGNISQDSGEGVVKEKELTVSDFQLELPYGMNKNHVGKGINFDVVMRIKNHSDKDIWGENIRIEWQYTDVNNEKTIFASNTMKEEFEDGDYLFKAGQEVEVHFPVKLKSDMKNGSLKFYRIQCDAEYDSEDSWRNWFVLRNGQIQFYDNGYREGAVDYNGELDFNVDDTKTMEVKPSFRRVTVQMPYSKGCKPDVIIAYNSSKDAPVLPKSEYTVTYNKPITGVGDYKIIIKFKNGYKGTLTQNLRVIPMYPDVISVKAGKKKMDLKWRYYNKEADGCQIQYSQDKNLKKNVKTIKTKKITSKKITKLKAKKKYYVRMRTYKKVKGKTYVSSWTKVKAVKIKK